MIIRDALYGGFELPVFLEPLVMAPEFRRLSEVRLININSASLAALADVRRYSHTLGALRLALSNPLATFSQDEHRALLASIIVHDAGTPAFAHLFEYFLLDRFSWDHESIVPKLLRRKHHSDANSHQIYGSHNPQFEKLCAQAKVDFELVLAILDGRHPGSRLIFGSVDFDNIDNVARMNWMMGYRFDIRSLEKLAEEIGVRDDGALLIPLSAEPHLKLWAQLRRQAYDVLVFDAPTVAGQAVLSRAISDALEDQTLDVDDWVYDDNELIRTIREGSKSGKLRLQRDFFGNLPDLKLIGQIFDPAHPLMAMGREAISEIVEEYLKEQVQVVHPYGYSLRDKGTFEKKIDAIDPNSGIPWTLGSRSNSIVVYGFGSSGHKSLDPRLQFANFEDWLKVRLC